VHIDARTLADGSLIEGDLCIVGAGAAGISMALDWANTSRTVILLEGGGFEYEDEVQELYRGTTSGQKYYPLKSARLHYFGGTTGHWAGMCAPFDPVDFARRDWVPHSGWPITREELEPYYVRANPKVQIGPYPYDFAYWRREVPTLAPLPLDERVVWNKMWQFSQARFGTLYREEMVRARNIHLHTHANVVDIRANEGLTAIEEVVAKNATGKSYRVRAKHFVLACCAIQNARLLLASRSQMPQGLGNAHDLVGRFFMEHLEISSSELWLFKPFPTALYSWPERVPPARAELAIAPEVQERHRILNGTASLKPLAVGRRERPRIETWQSQDPRAAADSMFADWGRAAKEAEGDTGGALDHAFLLDTRIEQAPNPNSRVTLTGERDALGVPRVNLHWELTALDKDSIRTIHRIIGQEVGKAGLGRVRLLDFLADEDDDSWPATTNGGWHHMGTTRMHEDPTQGVVDANCRVHGLANLHVAGSACFPTAGAPNPTLTVIALSLRLSDHLKSLA
jgi:choline dehydrogenase-like flavoprotein